MNILKKIEEKEAEIKALSEKIENAENGAPHSSSALENWRAKELVLNNQLVELYKHIPQGKQL